VTTARELPDLVTAELERRADPATAAGMAAYMKSDMPCFGVPKPGRAEIEREIRRRFAAPGRRELERTVKALWRRPHREEKYLAIAVARTWPERIGPASLPLYERLIREGAWWDFVDEIAIRLVGRAWRDDPAAVAPVMDVWIDDDDLWIRRSALVAQVSAKEATDWRRLSRYCRRRMGEREFFVRKAIGWALRAYSTTEPERVLAFLERHRDELSGLSFREGARALRRAGHAL
jgi:3-methyladenine DNA glycosylase AlkD